MWRIEDEDNSRARKVCLIGVGTNKIFGWLNYGLKSESLNSKLTRGKSIKMSFFLIQINCKT